MTLLPDDEVADALAGLPGWTAAGGAIACEYRFRGFPDAVAFVVRLSYAAEAADHHPDLDIRYNRVRVTLSTHSEGGVTGRDLDLARAVAALVPN
jgi:4a-hydroxytetrahydrobiopterin dehydratase